MSGCCCRLYLRLSVLSWRYTLQLIDDIYCQHHSACCAAHDPVLDRRVTAAQQALDARNLRWRERRKKEDVKEDNRAVAERLEAAEKAVNKFVAKRLQPAVQRVAPTSTYLDTTQPLRWQLFACPGAIIS